MLQLVLFVLEGGWGEAWGWMPLPNRPQRYCDPESHVLCRVLRDFTGDFVRRSVRRSVTNVHVFFSIQKVIPYQRRYESVKDFCERHLVFGFCFCSLMILESLSI